ncbi:MAG: HEAT repeat domain-containing protein [bacterium]
MTIPNRARVVASLVAAIAASHTANAQSLESKVASARGTVAFQYVTRPNVCGSGESLTISTDTSTGWNTHGIPRGMRIGAFSGDDSRCDVGPARVIITRTGDSISRIRVTVGGVPSPADTELGVVSSADAAHYLLAIAPSLKGSVGDKAILGAALADSVVIWKRLIEIARDSRASEGSRKAALLWVSQEVGAAATVGIGEVATDDAAQLSVRQSALFELGQRQGGDGIPALLKVARESKSATLRKAAIWDLAQSNDPRALDFFEKILAGKVSP